MKRVLTLLILIFSFGVSFSQDGVEKGVIRVKLKSDANQVLTKSISSVKTRSVDITKKVSTGMASVDALTKKHKAVSITRVFPHAGKHEAKQEAHGLHLWYEIKINDKSNVLDIANIFGKDTNIEKAEPIFTKKYISDTAHISALDVTVNDPTFDRQWHFFNSGQVGTAGVDIRLPQAWNITTGSPNVIVAVMDGGVDYSHEDLAGNMWINWDEYNGTRGIDNDGNGYIDDIYGANFGNGYNNGNIIPTQHGTHVAGLIAAMNNNGKGGAGIAGGLGSAKGVKIMSCQILFENDTRGSNDAAAIAYAANNGAVILQCSWGYDIEGAKEQSVLDAIKYFIATAGKDSNGDPLPNTPMVGGIVIFAAGNDNSSGKWYPAYYDEVLAVAAVDYDGFRAPYSNYGDWIDIAAPGGNTSKTRGGIYSTLPNNRYGYLQGTSMACPHVSGVAALILSKYGSATYTPEELWKRLVSTTTSLKQWDSENYMNMGSGLLNAELALSEDNGIPPNVITDLDVVDTFSTSVLLTWTAPSDDDTGNAALYTIVASKNPITIANFDAAEIKNTTNATPAGTTEIITLTGLTNSEKYYIVVISEDIWGNKSTISNIIEIITKNHAPISKGIAPITLRDAETNVTIDLDTIFTDPDGDIMTFTVENVNSSIYTASVNQNMLVINPVSIGNVIIKVTATDVYGLSVSDYFDITIIHNHAPVPVAPGITITLTRDSRVENIDLSEYFTDPENDPIINYNITQTGGIVQLNLQMPILQITAISYGETELQITAIDKYNSEGTAFIINVISEIVSSGEIHVWPIPVTSSLNYSFNIQKESNVEIRVIGTDGGIVYRNQNKKYTTGTHAETINTSSWPQGMYVLQYLVNGKTVEAKKIVK